MRQAYKIVSTVLAAAALLASSCVKEDLSKCRPTKSVTTLKLIFVPRQMDVTPTAADLKLAAVYIFDSAGNVLTTWTKTDPALNTPYDTGVILGDDTYRLVAWINPGSPYNLSPPYTRSALSDGKLALDIPSGGEVTQQLPLLFYGSVEQVVAPTTNTSVEIPLTLDTYRVNVTLNNVPQDGSTSRLVIHDTNGAYDFNNNFLETPGFNYVNSATAGSGGGKGNITLSINMLRLANGRSPQISVVNVTTGKTVFPQNGSASVNLVDLIEQTGVDLTTTHILNIEVPEQNTGPTGGTTVDVYINGWHVVMEDQNINPY
jgi:hypothetical protein